MIVSNAYPTRLSKLEGSDVPRPRLLTALLIVPTSSDSSEPSRLTMVVASTWRAIRAPSRLANCVTEAVAWLTRAEMAVNCVATPRSVVSEFPPATVWSVEDGKPYAALKGESRGWGTY